MSSQKTRVQLTCITCGKTFERTPARVRSNGMHFCSPLCSQNRAAENRITQTCPTCGKTFTYCPSKGYRKHCSATCRNATHERFWSKVDKSDDCWVWKGAKSPGGYGQFWYNDKLRRATHYAWEITYGPVPNGLFVCHHCDNPPCIRPDHLFVGTRSDNAMDAVAKGRNGMQRYPERSSFRDKTKKVQVRGEQAGSAKLTDEKVRLIRKLHEEGKTSKVIAPIVGVHDSTVRKIIRGEWWRHVQ